MQVPLSVVVPAATAGLAYLNAKTSFSYDYNLLKSLVKSTVRMRLREYRDRLNLFYTLEEYALAKDADRTFMVYEGKEWSYKQTYDQVLKYGTWLKQKYNVKPKEIVAMDFMNSHNFVFFWLGLWSIGAQPAFINYNLTGKPLVHCVKTSTARILFVDPELTTLTPEVIAEISSPDFRGEGQGGVEIVTFHLDIEAEVNAVKGIRAPDSDRGDRTPPDMAMLIFTSGTTGLPKPAICSWNKCNVASMFAFQWMGLKTADRMYTCMPLYHSSAAILGFLTMLQGHGSISIGRKFSARSFFRDAALSHSTLIQYVGETCRYLLSSPPSKHDRSHNIRMAFGNGLRPDVWESFKARFGIETIAEFYAATEGTSGSWNLSRNSFASGAIGRNGTVARALLGSQLAVVRVDWSTEAPFRSSTTGLCEAVPVGGNGELLYKLDPTDINKKFQGYFNNPGASASKVIRNVFTKGDAYFRTGDVVRCDHEGRWYFTDRIGDTFRWKSENVSTSEVSQALGLHPHVLEANVYGIPLPHHDGRAGCAAVVLKAEPTPELMEKIAGHARESLPKYAVPLFLRVVGREGGMEVTGTMKQQKSVLREEGVDPGRVGGDRVFWLQKGKYVPFGEREWMAVGRGEIKL